MRWCTLLLATSAFALTTVRVPDSGIQPQIALDRSGTIHMVYLEGNPKASDVFYVHSKDGVQFSSPMRVNSQPGSAIGMGTIRGAQIAIGANGRVHIAWDGSSAAAPRGQVNPESKTAGEPMLYTRLNDAGTAFEPQRNLMTHTFGLDGGGSIAADDTGNVYVAWHGKALQGAAKGEAGRAVWIARSKDNGRTFEPESLATTQPTGACGCCQMKIFASRQGNVYVLYRSATEEVHRDIYLLTSTDHGQTFRTRLLHKWEINACPMSSMSFAEGPNGVIAAWETNGQVYWQNVTSEGSSPVSAPGAGKGRKHPVVVVNPAGDVLFAWTEGTGWQRGGSLSSQVFDAAGKPKSSVTSAPGVPVWGLAAAFVRPSGEFTVVY